MTLFAEEQTTVPLIANDSPIVSKGALIQITHLTEKEHLHRTLSIGKKKAP